MFDELKKKAEDLAGQNPEMVEKVSDQVIEKVGDAVDSATGGKFSGQIDQAQAAADGAVGN